MTESSVSTAHQLPLFQTNVNRKDGQRIIKDLRISGGFITFSLQLIQCTLHSSISIAGVFVKKSEICTAPLTRDTVSVISRFKFVNSFPLRFR